MKLPPPGGIPLKYNLSTSVHHTISEEFRRNQHGFAKLWALPGPRPSLRAEIVWMTAAYDGAHAKSNIDICASSVA
jgi:hypothetical protein